MVGEPSGEDLSGVVPRPAGPDDVPELVDLAHDAIARIYVEPGEEFEGMDLAAFGRGLARFSRAVDEDAAGCWVVDDPDTERRLLGAAVSLRRGNLWFLSMFGVRPRAQGLGVGARVLAAAETYAEGAKAGMLLASRDPKALRRYWRAGFGLEPAYYGEGEPDRSVIPAGLGVVEGDVDRDAELIDDVDRAQRGYERRRDVAMLAGTGNLLVARPGGTDASRGYVVIDDGVVRCLAASDPATSSRLLWAALGSVPAEKKATLEWLTARAPWAVDIAVAARLSLGYSGSLAIRGDVGPMTSYLPSGAWG